MTIDTLLATPSELTDPAGTGSKCAVVLMTRIRLARNLARHSFPGWARETDRADVLARCREAVSSSAPMKRSMQAAIGDLSEQQKQMLVERHLISRELSGTKGPSGVVINKDQTFSVMINEEDHLRIQILRSGFQLKKAWAAIDALDTELEGKLDYAFDPALGYLTACPTNLGTGMRASAMMHLPALVISGQMEKVVRAVNQLGMVVRGLFGEGSDASGSIFQISNQTTLGESEDAIIKRLNTVLHSIIEHEENARGKLLENDGAKLFDKIGRAYGILQNCHLLTSSEAMNLLSLQRLGIDIGIFPAETRSVIDRLLIETQPGHIQNAAPTDLDTNHRDMLRADKLRAEFAAFAKPTFVKPTTQPTTETGTEEDPES
ncbi:protein arginine kinase [Geminisphaera colitermitum]|uniref:protein arginine kinase n=1 Tax=Geminisphaera colitermitum TaxID=1148786 RepID=UPI0001965275